MDQFLEGEQKYYNTRTPEGKGVADYFLKNFVNDRRAEDIKVNHNDYLNMSSVILKDEDYLKINIKHNINTVDTNISDIRLNQDNVSNVSRHDPTLMSGTFIDTNENNIYNIVDNKFYDFMGTYSYIAQCGYMANVNVIQFLCRKPHVPVYIDEKAHASFYDGILTARAKKIMFKHNDLLDLRQLTEKYGPGIIVVDSIYSGDGSIADLLELVQIKMEYKHLLVVDESHSFGIYGENGRGLCHYYNIIDKVDVITVSLSKCFSTNGGIVFSSKRNIIMAKEVGLPAIFSSVNGPDNLYRIYAVLDEIQHPRTNLNRKHLLNLSDYLVTKLNGRYNVKPRLFPTPIISIESAKEETTRLLQFYLQTQHRIFGAVFIFPAVGYNASIIRFTLNSKISFKDIDRIIEALDKYEHIIQQDPHAIEKLYNAKSKM